MASAGAAGGGDEAEEIEVYDVEVDSNSGAEVFVPAGQLESPPPPPPFVPGGLSMIGYTTLRVAAHELASMAAGGSGNGSGGGGGEDGRWLVEGTPRWLELRHPFGECDGLGCDLSAQVAACLSQGERSSALLLLVAAAAAVGVFQLVCAARHALVAGRSRRAERMRPAAACLVRALLLLAASVPVQRCEGDGGYGGSCAGKDFEYEGFEDARAVAHRGTLYLVATHEDCSGGRRVCLLKLAADRGGDGDGDGDGNGGDDAVRLRQAGVWPLRIEGGGLTLADIEKNWTPFVHAGALHLSYSLQPHVVLRCGWSGGRCEVVHNTSNAFLETYATLGQGIRGGTPYASLADGSMLAAAHVKDGSHSPALYGTVLYIVDGSPPFPVRSISPKLCISEREIELAISPRCALQYAVGLGVDETHNLALISLGEMDRVMKVAALPLDRLVALARTHTLHDDGVTDSECVTWSSTPAL